jgi:hypothetical protein
LQVLILNPEHSDFRRLGPTFCIAAPTRHAHHCTEGGVTHYEPRDDAAYALVRYGRIMDIAVILSGTRAFASSGEVLPSPVHHSRCKRRRVP